MPYWIISCFKLSIKINNSRTPQSEGWEINNQGSFLLTCFNFNPSVEKKLHPSVQVHVEINRSLTHWGRVTHMRQQTDHNWFRQWFVAWPAPNHYLNQCWNIVNWTLSNKILWILNRNSYIFIHKNAVENVFCEMVVFLSRPQCVFRK